MATAHSSDQFVAGLGITGFGGGFCQMAMCAIPELMPNKFRHIGICLSDGFVYVIVVIGPIVGRVSVFSILDLFLSMDRADLGPLV